MSWGYEDRIKGAKDSLDDIIKSTSSFSTNCYFDYVKSIPEYPTVLLKLMRDNLSSIGPKETQHTIIFSATIHSKGTGTEANLDSIIGYVGEIVDVIEADRQIGDDYVRNTEIGEVDYTYRSTDTFVFYYAYLTITVEMLRNV